MTSKLRRTIVGVGIALGGAAPACFGRTDVADLSSYEEPDDLPNNPDTRTPDATPADASPPIRNDAGDGSVKPVTPMPDAAPPDASPPDASLPDAGPDVDADLVDAASDAAVDAANDGMDPFCEVSWPPTKGGPLPPRAPCVDPLNECENAFPPRGCFILAAPGVCGPDRTWEGPLYCINGEWRCPPGTEDGPRCVCFGPLPAGETCSDAG